MCDRLPSKNRRDLAADVPQRARDVPAHYQRPTVDDLVVMAKAWDDPHDTGGGMRAADLTMAARFRERPPEARIEVIDDANHLIPIDQPEIVEKLLGDFLQ